MVDMSGATLTVLVVTAHPLRDSLCGLFTEQVVGSLNALGYDVTVENLYANQFDPVLSIDERTTYYNKEYDSSAVSAEIERLVNADALVLIFPTWWFGFPALLKGWFDRVWAPTVAYDHATDFGPIQPRLINLKKAFAITTLGAPWWVDYLILWRPVKRTLRFALLGACTNKCKLKFLSFYQCESVGSGKLAIMKKQIESELIRFFG